MNAPTAQYWVGQRGNCELPLAASQPGVFISGNPSISEPRIGVMSDSSRDDYVRR